MKTFMLVMFYLETNIVISSLAMQVATIRGIFISEFVNSQNWSKMTIF